VGGASAETVVGRVEAGIDVLFAALGCLDCGLGHVNVPNPRRVHNRRECSLAIPAFLPEPYVVEPVVKVSTGGFKAGDVVRSAVRTTERYCCSLFLYRLSSFFCRAHCFLLMPGGDGRPYLYASHAVSNNSFAAPFSKIEKINVCVKF
jgi:hypothetical protein